MVLVSRRSFLLLAPMSLLAGCNRQPTHYQKPVSKVTGKLIIDGEEPGSPVKIECIPISQVDEDPAHYSVSLTMTNDDGTFEIATYKAGDGVPDGEYVLVIFWGTFNVMARSYSGPDKLKGRYSDAKKSEIKFTVAGEPVDLGDIELATK